MKPFFSFRDEEESKTEEMGDDSLFMFERKDKMRGSSFSLLEKLLEGGVAIRVLLHDLGDGHLKVLLVDMHTSLTEGVHTSLSTDSLLGGFFFDGLTSGH